jgi:Zn-dependent protease
MAIITGSELVDIVIMTAAVGFILMGFFRSAIYFYQRKMPPPGFDWEAFKFSIIVTAPAVVLHELAHKFVALALGIDAVFHAAYTFLGVGILLKLMNVGFIFFVPGYVAISKGATHLQTALIAGAGPFTNLAIALFAIGMLKFNTKMSKKAKVIWHMTKIINLFLFVFNMLPFWIFDGQKFFSGLYHAFF